MKYATAVAVLLSAGFMIRAWVVRGDNDGTQPAPGAAAVVVLGAHTLESLARQIDDPSVFRYDPATRTAVCRRSLVIDGTLTLGQADRPDGGQTLEMDTDKCGSLMLEVGPGGTLALHHSTVTTVEKVQAGGPCPKGYGLTVRGRLLMIGSNLDFMSGTVSESLLAGSSAEIRNSSIVRGDGVCLRLIDPPDGRYTVEGSVLGTADSWAVAVIGTSDAPRRVVLNNCRFHAVFGPVNNLSPAAVVDLIDCNLGRNPRFGFGRASDKAAVRVRWTMGVQVNVRRTDGVRSPAAGVEVRLLNLDGSSIPDDDARATTDSGGRARLTATQFTATPAAAEPPAGDGPTHRLVVLRNGVAVGGQPVAVRGKGLEVQTEFSEN
jgi:hypothetical protein